MATFVRTIEKKGRIDEPKHWADTDIIRRPVFDVSAFQNKIDKAIGVSKDGFPIIRLRWTWDPDCYSEYYTEWDSNGVPTKSEFRAKYRFTTIKVDGENDFEIPPPRWVLEELTTPEQYGDAWERARFQFDKTLNRTVATKPPAPRTGYYVFYKYIAEHDPDNECCQRALDADEECYGVYRKPLDFDVLQLKKIWHHIQRDKNRPDPYRPLTERDLAVIEAAADASARDRLEAQMLENEDKRKFYNDVLAPRREFSLPAGTPEKRTPSGLILLN